METKQAEPTGIPTVGEHVPEETVVRLMSVNERVRGGGRFELRGWVVAVCFGCHRDGHWGWAVTVVDRPVAPAKAAAVSPKPRAKRAANISRLTSKELLKAHRDLSEDLRVAQEKHARAEDRIDPKAAHKWESVAGDIGAKLSAVERELDSRGVDFPSFY